MTKLEIQSIQTLPEEFVRDGTVVATCGKYIVAINPIWPPMIYENGQWRPMPTDGAEEILK
jgi:hypothetical protein